MLDLDARTAEVLGTGLVTVRRHGRSRTYPSGTTLGFADLLAAAAAAAAAACGAAPEPTPDAGPAPAAGPQHLNHVADAEEARFRAGLDAGEVDDVVATILRLDQILEDWSADPSDERDYARSVLRGMVVQLGERARTGLADPRAAVAPYVDALLEVREQARDGRDFGTADLIRDRLAAAGVEVRDTPDGPRWLPARAADGVPG